MKPLYLEIEGVKSVAEKQTIDFEKVSKSGIFGVFGKTGSGKTTILDSIVLAIYGSITGNVDNKDFINIGCNFARVNLLFSVTGMGKTTKYRVERSYKLDKKRENATSSAKLWEVTDEGEICLSEGSSKVSKKLEEEIIGLEQKEFLRCIALPQGAFADFLNLTRSHRLSFIGKLFGLEKYGKPLANKVSLKLRGLIESERVEQGMLGAYAEYTDDAVKECAQKLKSAEEELNLCKAEKEAQKSQFNLIKERYELGVLRAKKQEQYNEKLAYKSVIDDLAQKIKLFDQVFAVKNDIKRYQDANQTIKQVEEAIKELDKKGKEIQLRQKKAKRDREMIPDLTLDLDILKGRLLMINELEPKIEACDQKKTKLMALRDAHRKLIDEAEKLKGEIAKGEAEYQSYLELAKSQDVKSALNELSKQASSQVFIEFAKEELALLEEALFLLSREEISPSSAVNRLIEGGIQKIRSILQCEASNLEGDLLARCLEVLDKNSEYLKRAQAQEVKNTALKEKLIALQQRMEKSKEEGLEIKNEFESLQAEINAVLQGKSLSDASKEVVAKIKELTIKIEKINDEFDEMEKEVNKMALDLNTQEVIRKSAEKDIYETQFVIEDILFETKLDYDGVLAILKEEGKRASDRAMVDSYNLECERLKIEIGELNEKLKEGVIEAEVYQKAHQNYSEIEQKVENLIEIFGKIKSYYENVLNKNKEWCIINNNIKEILREKEVLSKLYELVKDSKFMEFIAEVYLKEIAKDAEKRVLSLTSGKYGLVYEGDSFYVIDNMRGGRKRPAVGLSGGETFLISLSLALALSFQISKKASRTLEFFFLDEGFGTLDDELLDAVTTALEKLQRANLTVGLITHVGELKNRIGARIEVTEATALHGTLISCNC